jgi:hypothetical protein
MPSPKRTSPKRTSPKRNGSPFRNVIHVHRAPATLRPVSTNRALKIVFGLVPANRTAVKRAFVSLPPSLRASLISRR